MASYMSHTESMKTAEGALLSKEIAYRSGAVSGGMAIGTGELLLWSVALAANPGLGLILGAIGVVAGMDNIHDAFSIKQIKDILAEMTNIIKSNPRIYLPTTKEEFNMHIKAKDPKDIISYLTNLLVKVRFLARAFEKKKEDVAKFSYNYKSPMTKKLNF